MTTPSSTPPGTWALERAVIALRAVAVLLLTLIACLVVAQVVGRNLFDTGMPWADELARMSGVALVFLTVPLLSLRSQHVAVDLVPSLLTGRLRRGLAVLVEIAILAFAGFALWGLQAFLARAGQFATPSLGIPNWLTYAPVVLCFLILAVISLLRVLRLAKGEDPSATSETVPDR